MSIPDSVEVLNEREQEIIGCLADGLTNREIADRLFLAPSTVKWYIRQLNQKLDTANRHEIVERVQELGLLEAEIPQESYFRPRENLPRQTTPFVGRDSELDELHAIIEKEDIRLLTILAPGGMGKTRIALEATEQQINRFPDGVYFVPLQALSEPEQIISQIASSTFFSFQSDNRSQKQQLLDFLSNKTMLLCIDNWEHLLDGALLINEVLADAPNVKIIATSREKLNLLSETVYILQGMQFPEWETPDDALRYDAVQLLVQSAQRVKPDWMITEENLDYVARVCRLTQGMPLGILLASSWLDVYSLERICAEIQKSADILETDMRDVPARQRSIRAVFDTSWERLKPKEQDVLMKMSVFRGGCSPKAAESITGANPRILQSLVNKALLLRNKDGRYDLHELLRQYAEKKLDESSEHTLVIAGYGRYFANLMSEYAPDLVTLYEKNAIPVLEADFQNIVAAWFRVLDASQFELIDQMVSPIDIFYQETQRETDDLFIEAYQRLSHLGNEVNKHIWAKLALRITYGKEREDDFLHNVRACFDISRERNDKLEIALCHSRMSGIHLGKGELEQSLHEIDFSLSILDEISAEDKYLIVITRKIFTLNLLEQKSQLTQLRKDFLLRTKRTNIPSYIAIALKMLSSDYTDTENYPQALNLLKEAFHIVDDTNDKARMVDILLDIGCVSLYLHNVSQAYEYARQAEKISVEINDIKLKALAIRLMAECHIAGLDYKQANILLNRSIELREGGGAMKHKYLLSILQDNASDALYWLNKDVIDWLKNYPVMKQWIYQHYLYISSYYISAHGNPAYATEIMSLSHFIPNLSTPQFRWLTELEPFQELQRTLLEEQGKDMYDAAWERGKTLDIDTVMQDIIDLLESEKPASL